jgi:hypothetical protein
MYPPPPTVRQYRNLTDGELLRENGEKFHGNIKAKGALFMQYGVSIVQRMKAGSNEC